MVFFPLLLCSKDLFCFDFRSVFSGFLSKMYMFFLVINKFYSDTTFASFFYFEARSLLFFRAFSLFWNFPFIWLFTSVILLLFDPVFYLLFVLLNFSWRNSLIVLLSEVFSNILFFFFFLSLCEFRLDEAFTEYSVFIFL